MNKLKSMPKPLLYLLICQALVLLFALGGYALKGAAYQEIFVTGEWETTQDETGVTIKTIPVELEKGVYEVTIHYIAQREGLKVQGFCSNLNSLEFICPAVTLIPTEYMTTMRIDVSRTAKEVYLYSHFEKEEDLTISQIDINETSDLYKRNMFHAILLCGLLALGYKFFVSDTKTRQVMLVLVGTFLVSCYPLYTDYLPVGHDIPFHLLRIEGIQTGLSQGVFPVKIHPMWAQDYGYAVGVFYGDLLLYFPAFLRLIGFTIQEAYKYFAAAMNLGTIVISYFAFKRMFASRKIGLIAMVGYTLSIYRLIDVYTRASVGEYSAMMFLPVVLLGFYLIFTDTKKENWLKNALIVAVGLTGVVQSHVLSCEMLVVFIVLGCLILVRKVFTKYIFLALATGAGLCVLFNLGFLVPFLDMYQSDLYINTENWMASYNGIVQEQGMFPMQLFTLFPNSVGGSWLTAAGVSTEVTFNAGVFLLIGVVIYLYVILCHQQTCKADNNYYPTMICFGFGGLALWMSTCYFPWEAIADIHPLLNKLVVSLQFPWRFLAMATIFLTFVMGYSLKQLEKVVSESKYMAVFSVSIVLLAVNVGWFYYDFAFEGTPYRVYETYEMDSMQMYSYEYLPTTVNPKLIEKNLVLGDGIESIDQYRKEGTKITCLLDIGERGGYIDLPLNYYKYYQGKDAATGEDLYTTTGYNGMVRVELPSDYDGMLEVTFQTPWFWTMSELTSVLAFVVTSVLILTTRYRKKNV